MKQNSHMLWSKSLGLLQRAPKKRRAKREKEEKVGEKFKSTMNEENKVYFRVCEVDCGFVRVFLFMDSCRGCAPHTGMLCI